MVQTAFLLEKMLLERVKAAEPEARPSAQRATQNTSRAAQVKLGLLERQQEGSSTLQSASAFECQRYRP